MFVVHEGLQLALASGDKRPFHPYITQVKAPATVQLYLLQAMAHNRFVNGLPDRGSDDDRLAVPGGCGEGGISYTMVDCSTADLAGCVV